MATAIDHSQLVQMRQNATILAPIHASFPDNIKGTTDKIGNQRMFASRIMCHCCNFFRSLPLEYSTEMEIDCRQSYCFYTSFLQNLMRGDSWREDIQSLGQDFEANKKGSPFLHLEEILSSAAFLDEGFLKLKSFKYSSHVPFTIFPSHPVQAIQPSK